MTIEFTPPELTELTPKITVFGVGGAGGNAVNNMIRSELKGVDFVVANTDAQALVNALADQKIQLGAELTQGLGAGSRPEVGKAAAEETMQVIKEHLEGSHMVFITAGMGGGTGTGAAPMIAQAARESGILTVAVVTKPFQFEGSRRMKLADQGIEELSKYVDTLIIIPNQNLFRIANERTTMADAFSMADEVLHSGVRGITDLMVIPGLVNLDFADVRTVMSEMGNAMMGTGEAEGENRAKEAAEAAISNPLLDEVSMKGAAGVLINITGGMDLTLFEVDEAANRIRSEVDPDANILVGSALDPALDGTMRVSVVATGITADGKVRPVPVRNDLLAKTAQASQVEEEAEVSANNTAVEVPLDLTELARTENNSLISQLDVEVIKEVKEDIPSMDNDKDAPFIAPSPILPDETDSLDVFSTRHGDLETKIDPFAEADMLNPTFEKMEAPKKRGGSLSVMLEGGKRNKKTVLDSDLSQQGELLTVALNNVFGEQKESQNTGEVSRSMSSLTVGEPISSKVINKEDNLKIPAFLRRQAN